MAQQRKVEAVKVGAKWFPILSLSPAPPFPLLSSNFTDCKKEKPLRSDECARMLPEVHAWVPGCSFP